MTTTTLAAPPLTRRAARRPWTVAALLCLIALGLGIAFPGHALDLVAFTGITGPLTSALTAIASLGPGIKALVGFVGFVVALISLSALRNFGPVLFYVGLAIFAAGLFPSRWIARIKADKPPAFAIHWLYWHLPTSPLTAMRATPPSHIRRMVG